MSELSDKLKANGLTIAAAESLTGGLVQAALTSESGASQFFQGGITAYNIHQKVEHLGVDGTHAQQVNCVSMHVACQMAEGVRKMFGADIGVATTGYAEPSPENGVIEPYAEIAISFADDGALLYWRVTPGILGRTAVRQAVVDALLSELTRILV